MVKKITRDPMFLAQKSVDATEADKQVITDLLDTLRANLDHCVGMAANMIGVSKNIIVVAAGPFQFAMINPVITKKTGAFQTEEGCLSLDGVRPCTRYKEIEVDYLDTNFKKQHGKCSTCQKAKKWLDGKDIAYTEPNIAEENPTYEELKEWYEKSGLPLKKFFNTSGLLYKSMQLKDKLPDMSEEEQLKLLATDGMLVKRPLVVDGDTVLTGFREVEWTEKLLS